MLLNDLFIVDDWQPVIVDDWQPGDATLRASLRVRVPHPILEGHFPGRPVLPGACLVQLVEELAASVTGSRVGGPLRLIRAGPVKFIAMIDPVLDGIVEMTMTAKALPTKELTAKAQPTKEPPPGEWQITAEGINRGTTCFRFKGIFRAGSDYAE